MNTLSKTTKLCLLVSGTVCLGIFIMSATPLLLGVLNPLWLEVLGMFLIVSGMGVFAVCTAFWFLWMAEEMEEYRHSHRTRRQRREIAVIEREKELSEQKTCQRSHTHLITQQQGSRRLWRQRKLP